MHSFTHLQYQMDHGVPFLGPEINRSRTGEEWIGKDGLGGISLEILS